MTSPVPKEGPNGFPVPEQRKELPSSPWYPSESFSQPGSLLSETLAQLSPIAMYLFKWRN